MVTFNWVERWFLLCFQYWKAVEERSSCSQSFCVTFFFAVKCDCPVSICFAGASPNSPISNHHIFCDIFTFRSTYEIAPKSCSARMKILTRIDNFFINFSIFSSIFSQNKILAAFCLFAKIWFSARNAHPNSKPNIRIRRPSRQWRHDLNKC